MSPTWRILPQHGPNMRQSVPNMSSDIGQQYPKMCPTNVVAQGGDISEHVSPTATARHTESRTHFTFGCKRVISGIPKKILPRMASTWPPAAKRAQHGGQWPDAGPRFTTHTWAQSRPLQRLHRPRAPQPTRKLHAPHIHTPSSSPPLTLCIPWHKQI